MTYNNVDYLIYLTNKDMNLEGLLYLFGPQPNPPAGPESSLMPQEILSKRILYLQIIILFIVYKR